MAAILNAEPPELEPAGLPERIARVIARWNEAAAVISPDGRFVAFISDRDGEFDVWLSQVGTGTFANLTRHLPPLPPPGRVLRSLGFTAGYSRFPLTAVHRCASSPGRQSIRCGHPTEATCSTRASSSPEESTSVPSAPMVQRCRWPDG